ncbi:hypothetical protein ACFSJ3_03960 [Corallincola platygyrae]|uniref:Uncharacterized protein n=1 Tax=Corallincola platygyrae TaxID=1193278 RepID=A0ABW4XJ59_9GAMM
MPENAESKRKQAVQVVAKVVLNATILATLLAAIPTFIDWKTNPGGIFQTEIGTQWTPVFETWFSWAWPFFFAFLPITLFMLDWRTEKPNKDHGMGPDEYE